MNNVAGLYTFIQSFRQRKERYDIILEPLQAILQIGFLGYLPVGTKLTIYNNILYTQIADWSQPVLRLYYNDTKEDLFYLFHVIMRFSKFYDSWRYESETSVKFKLYHLLIEMASLGLDRLIETYKHSTKTSILHILMMYKALLMNGVEIQNSVDRVRRESDDSEDDVRSVVHQVGGMLPTGDLEKSIKMDTVFEKIRDIYMIEEIEIIYNCCCMIKKEKKERTHDNQKYIDGLRMIMEPIHIRIQRWISENVCM